MMKRLYIPVLLVVAWACTHDKGLNPALLAKSGTCDSISYAKHIVPLINTQCATVGCHSSGSGNGDFTAYVGVKAKVDNNTFNNRVVVLGDMPPGGALQSADLEKIKCWLGKGAPNN